jgi:hypothetical protein
MKKKLLFILSMIVLAGLVLRFVEVPSPKLSGNPAPKNCIPTKDATTDADGFPIDHPMHLCKDLEAINLSYQKEIRPIFVAKCLMCHGNVDKVPLYSKIPPMSLLVDDDIRNAKKDLDMSYEFPFQSRKKSVEGDLERIRDVIKANSMPPFVYKIMHWQSGLTNSEKQKILDWVSQSEQILQQ